MLNPTKIFFLFTWLILFAAFLLHYLVVGQATYGDGRFYYSYARSLAVDGNLDIQDELGHVWSPSFNNSYKSDISLPKQPYPVQFLGPSLIWVLPLSLVHQSLRLFNHFGANFSTTGYSDIYQISLGLFSTLLSSLALTLCLRSQKQPNLKTISVTLAFLLGTNLIYYLGLDTFNTHFLSFFLSSLFVYLFLKKSKFKFTGLVYGLIFGLAFINRNHDVLTFVPFLLYLLWQHQGLKAKLNFVSQVSFGTLLFVLPQLLVWQGQFGSLLPPMASANFWVAPLSHLLDLFLNPKIGLIIYSPLVFISIIYLFRNHKTFAILTLISLGLQLALISSWWAWSQGESYGVRMLITLYPFLLVSLLDSGLSKFSFKKLIMISVGLIVLNLVFMLRFMLLETSSSGQGLDPFTAERLKIFTSKLGW